MLSDTEPSMERINERFPEWWEEINNIHCLETRGELMLWLVQEHLITELISESLWQDNFVAEYILEVFNPERTEMLYEKTREAMWRFSEEILREALVEENTKYHEALKEEANV